MKKLIIASYFLSQVSHAFVAGPGQVNPNENLISIENQSERGKVEPNENRTSFQDAQIDIQKLRYTRGFDQILSINGAQLYAEIGQFKSAKEQVGTTVFYEADQGSYLTLGLTGDLAHSLDKKFGFYFQFSPTRNYNENKFSNPRIDVFAAGLTSSFSITDNLFQKQLIHFGSGDGGTQNSYIAFDSGFGYKLDSLVGRQMTLGGSLFIEADTSQRTDSSYDAAFSPAGTQDRIRAFKYGTVYSADIALANSLSLKLNYLQKLGGYDARSTEILTLNLGYKF